MSSSNDPDRGGTEQGIFPNSPAPPPSASIPLRKSAPRHRPGYARVPSVSFNDTPSTAHAAEISTSAPRGLGIAMAAGSPAKMRRASSPLSQRDSEYHLKASPSEEASTHTVPSSPPPSTGRLSGSTRYDDSFGNFDTSYQGPRTPANPSVASFHSGAPSTYPRSDAGLLSTRSQQWDDFLAQRQDRGTTRVKQKLGSWVSITILVLAIFSTVFSLIFLILAGTGRRYDHIRTNGGRLTPSTAAFLTSFFAKMIELSFVTIIVAYLGQSLARRAFKLEDARGVTLAEISMRSWIMQPGIMLTQWESVRYAGITYLGVFSLLAATLAILYTSAATALVQPQLRWPGWSGTTLQGLVRTQYANPYYIAASCKTPITSSYDAEYFGTTCLSMEHAAMAFHNWFAYQSQWTDAIHAGNSTDDLATRPKGFALLSDNTTISAPFIEHRNVTIFNETRYINNVTMAMPHVGVIQAAIDPINKIMQPSDIDGASYHVIASVPSPFINVICVTVQEEDLTPFVYDMWGNWTQNWTASAWPQYVRYPDGIDAYLNGTQFDEIFGWGPDKGAAKYPPIFPTKPIDYNTIINDTVGASWGRTTIYLLGKGGPLDYIGSPSDKNYALCQLQVGLTPNCSTHYNASSSGATMEAVCEDMSDPLRFQQSVPAALYGNDTLNKDWPNIGSQWASSLSLNTGVYQGNGSNSRLLTQMMVTSGKLNTALPSMAEALAVMAGCTLIQSITDAPFAEFWNYTLSTLDPGRYQYFKASIQAQQYFSGGHQDYQQGFYLVLIGVFLMSTMVLVYILIHKDWYTDFSDPLNLFALAVNSPPDQKLAGAGGGGPRGDHYMMSWKLNHDAGHVYMESQEREGGAGESPRGTRQRWTESIEMVKSPLVGFAKRMSYSRATP